MSKKSAVDVKASGAFVMKDSVFRNWVKADGSTAFPAEANRYHLYVSYACPFASRALVLRSLKGLQSVISLDVVDWFKDDQGWRFNPEVPGATPDSIHGYTKLRQVYGGDDYGGKVTVPVLYDKKAGVIVNNESSEIIRMLNSEFNEFCATQEQKDLDFYPETLRGEIDSINDWIYPMLNIGVYMAGFAQSQQAYDAAVHEVFNGLDKVEEILSKTRYLVGGQLTEADVRLFTTLIRFDLVYVLHFKCNRKQVVDYPNMWGYLRDVYQTPGVKETVNFEHIVKSYYVGQTHVNPFGIVPINPILDFDSPHGRDNM